MKTARIQIDGLGYYGESTDTYATDYAGDGWHLGNHHQRQRLDIRTGDGQPIEGIRNLKSHLERIMAAIKAGQVDATEIKITLGQEVNA